MPDYVISVQLNAIDNASQAVQDLNNALKGIGEETEKQKNQAPEQASAWENYKNAINNVGTAIGTVQMAMDMLGQGLEIVDLGENVHAVSAAFQALQGDAATAAETLQAVRDATSGVLDDTSIMSAVNRMQSMGLANTSSEFAELIGMAQQLGSVMSPGATAAQNIDNFTLLLANQSVRRLDSFGISADAVRQRIEELKESGMSAGEAFNQATLEQGRLALERLGDAATVGATNVDRLSARFTNMWNSFAEGAASTTNQAITTLDQLVYIFNYYSDQIDLAVANLLTGNTGGNPTVDPQVHAGDWSPTGNQGYTAEQAAAQAQAEADALAARRESERIASQQNADAAELVRQAIAAKDAAKDMEAAINGWRTGSMQLRSDVEQAQISFSALTSDLELSIIPLSQVSGLIAQGADTATAMSATLSTAMGMYDYQGFASTTIYGTERGGAGGQDLFLPSELQAANEMAGYYHDLLEDAEQLHDQGLITDAELANVQAAADQTAGLADAAERGAEAFANMTLEQGLGVSSGGMAGEVASDVEEYLQANGYSAQQVSQYSQTAGLATGTVTQSSMAYNDIIVPMIADILNQYGAQAAAQATMDVQTGMQMGQYMGMSDQEIANSMQGMTGYETQTASAMGFQGLGTNTQGQVITGETEGFDPTTYMESMATADQSMQGMAQSSAEMKQNMVATGRAVHDITDGLAHSVTAFNSLNGRRVSMQADIQLNFSNRGMFEDFIRDVVTRMGGTGGSGGGGAHTPGAAGFGT